MTENDQTELSQPGGKPDELPAPKPRRRLRPWLRRSLIATGVFLFLLSISWYVFFAWAKTSGRLDHWLARKPERFQLHYAEIRSPLPFVFVLEGLTVAARTSRHGWQVDADHARVLVDPLALFERRLVLRDATAEGVVLHVVNAPHGDEPPRMATAREHRPPPISAFPEPLAPPSPPKSPSARAREPWSWVVASLALSDLREIWIDDLRATGHGEGNVGFAIERRELAEIFPSRLRFTAASLALGESIVADRLSGSFDVQIVPWRYRGAGPKEILPHAQGTMTLAGESTLAPAIHYLFGSRPWLEIGGDRGHFELEAKVDRGRLRDGSKLDALLEDPGLVAFGFVAHGNGALSAKVVGAEDKETLASRLALGEWTLARPGEPVLFSGKGLTIDAVAVAPRLDQPPKEAELDIDLGEGRAHDLRILNDVVPASAAITVDGGELALRGKLHVDATDRTGEGTIDLDGKQLELGIRGQKFGADLEVALRLSQADLKAGSFALDGSKLALRNVAAKTTAGGSVENWWSESALPRARVSLQKPFTSAGEIRSKFANTQPLIELYELKRDLPGWAERALFVEKVELSGRYRLSTGRLEMSDVKIPFSNGEARAELDLTRDRRKARMLLSWRNLDLGIEITGEQRDLHLRHARQWFESTVRSLPLPGPAPAQAPK